MNSLVFEKISWNVCTSALTVLTGLTLLITMMARKIFSFHHEVVMTQPSESKDFLREGWVSYTPRGDYFPKWYKVSLSSRQNSCRWELNFYSCESGFEGHGGQIDLRPYVDKFPKVIQMRDELQLIATEKPNGKDKAPHVKILDVKIFNNEEKCNSFLIAQGGHQHKRAYGIAWKRFFFGRLFG